MIVDTNALSAWRDGDRDLLGVLAPPHLLILPVIAIGEYRYGAGRSRQRAMAEAWLEDVASRIRVAPITVDTAISYASVRLMLRSKGTPIPANDMWIAALALQYRVPVLSRDTHFDVVDGLARIGW
ncbi:MAG: PIN domain-containing protein [Dehalococcoidia bacterium]|nr:PIN domain-containing protein [Dehalococcoidia bacterium]